MSILRSSKFFKYFISPAKNIFLSRHREINGALPRSSNFSTSSSFLNQQTHQQHKIEKIVQRLDQDVRRLGRVSKKEVESLLKDKKTLHHFSVTQSLMVIRCCGNLIPEEKPEVRTQLVKDIWVALDKIGVPLDISHYNALLKVYLENEHKFSPTEFLTDLQDKGIEPNRVTYQRLIAAYCQRGDIEGATKILQFMKEKAIPVNESVFSSLINGHFQADDPESAVGILSVMKQANIPPSAETYTVLMCGYAKTGNLNAIKDVLAQCEKEDVDITDNDILEVLYTLAVNNHSDLIDELTSKLKALPGYNQDAKNVILRLIAKGEDKAALKILKTMTKITLADGELLPVGSFLIKQMVKCNWPADKIVAVCKQLKESGDNEVGLLLAAEASLIHGNPDLSSKLMTALSEEHEVLQHYYWPILVQYGKKKQLKEIKNTLLQMVNEVRFPVGAETLRDYVAPYVPEGEQGIYTMWEAGISLASSAAAMVGHLISKNNFKYAANIALQFRANYGSVHLCKNIVASFANTKDIDSFIIFVRIIFDHSKDSNERYMTDKMLLDAIKMLGRSDTLVQAILKAYLDSGISIQAETAGEIQNSLPGKELTQEISTLLSKLTSPDLAPVELNRPELPRRPTHSMDEASILRCINAASAKGESAFGLKRQLLTLYCNNKDLEKAEQLSKELEESGFEFVTGSLVQLMELYLNYENLDKALQYYNKTFSDNPGIQIDPSKIMKLGAVMIKFDKIEEAIELFKKHSVASESLDRGFSNNNIAWRLLNNLAEKKDPHALKRVFNALVESNHIEPNNILLGPLIKVHLLRDDIDGAVAEFEECCRKYKSTPWKNEIACKLILKEDPVSLQKITDLSTEIHGEINSLYDLVLAFIECGRIRQARRILETPGLRFRSQRITSACERFTNEGKVTNLESLVEATKHLSHIDRSEIYYHLLSSYCKTDEVDKAESLWTQMQDEDVQPSDWFLIKLSHILKKHGRPIPFAVPEVKETDVQKTTKEVGATSLIRKFRKVMHSENADEALEILSRLKNDELSNGDRSKILNLLLTNGRIGEASKIFIDWLQKGYTPKINTMSFIMNSLAKLGDLDTMNAVGKFLSNDLKNLTSFSNRFAHCMVWAGRSAELISQLEEKLKHATTEEEIKIAREEFPRGGVFSLLEKSPDLIAKIEDLAKAYREKGILEPTNVLWAYHYSKGNNDKATEMWSHLNLENRILILPLLRTIRLSKDVALGRRLLSFLKESGVSKSYLSPVYCTLIDLENSRGNLDECERILNDALKDLQLDELKRPTLLRLKMSLEAEGKPFKHSIPSNKRKIKESSSDSDSDSDSETHEKAQAR